jgi:putative toxin-antitoxin system antitoxin component (TIGR02293 family)
MSETYMADVVFSETADAAEPDIQRIAALLGGARLLKRRLASLLDAHKLLLDGLPSPALRHLVDGLTVLETDASLERAIGMSLRTYQRRKSAPARPLNPEQSGRAWKFAAILSRATGVFGSQEEAEQWLERPAIGLDRQRPIDLLATPAGIDLVEDHLNRIRYGVYA